MYYRFDHDRSGLFFEGYVSPQMCLRPLCDTGSGETDGQYSVRPYPLDPQRGRQLIGNIPSPPEKVSIYVASPDLERLAHYFGDILARDRFAIEITRNKRAADLYLEFVPISNKVPSTTVYAIQHQLINDSIPGGTANENLRIGAGLAELIESATSEADYYRYLDRMSRLLITDLGVFPLFRPTVYFCADRTLQGVRFDADGFLDTSSAVKVIRPEPREEAP
jgi:hypothetical protein